MGLSRGRSSHVCDERTLAEGPDERRLPWSGPMMRLMSADVTRARPALRRAVLSPFCRDVPGRLAVTKVDRHRSPMQATGALPFDPWALHWVGCRVGGR